MACQKLPKFRMFRQGMGVSAKHCMATAAFACDAERMKQPPLG